MTGWSVGRLVVGCLVGWLIRSFVHSAPSSLLLLAVWLGWLVPLPERGHLGLQPAKLNLELSS